MFLGCGDHADKASARSLIGSKLYKTLYFQIYLKYKACLHRCKIYIATNTFKRISIKLQVFVAQHTCN